MPEPPHISPARGPPLGDGGGEAQIDEGVEIEPDWDPAAQPAPDYEVDQRVNWWLSEMAIALRCGVGCVRGEPKANLHPEVPHLGGCDPSNCTGQSRLLAQNSCKTCFNAVGIPICSAIRHAFHC